MSVFLYSLYNYINYNAKYTRDNFIKELCTYIPQRIKNVEKEINELTSQVENLSIRKITEGSSKYAQKQYRKHKKELASKKIEIENLKNKLNEINK
jgi:hypothetical protein